MPPKKIPKRALSPAVTPPSASPTKAPKRPSSPTSPATSQATKKLKLLSDFSSTSPFPDFAAPSPEDVHAVYDLLASTFPSGTAPKHTKPLDSANSGATCGATPSVLGSLIGTILSQNTSNGNSSSAKSSLDAAFGRGEEGLARIASAPAADVVAAIKRGGLANRKARTIQNLLASVRAAHPDARYDLQHLLAPGVSDADAMRALVRYDGVGPKTAACVLAFCMGRAAFAVDTHVFRIARVLGWVPRHADRVGAQAHLELRVPPELKYGLHVMFVKHGRACKGCKNGSRGECPLKTWMKQKGVKVEEVEERVGEAEEDLKMEAKKEEVEERVEEAEEELKMETKKEEVDERVEEAEEELKMETKKEEM